MLHKFCPLHGGAGVLVHCGAPCEHGPHSCSTHQWLQITMDAVDIHFDAWWCRCAGALLGLRVIVILKAPNSPLIACHGGCCCHSFDCMVIQLSCCTMGVPGEQGPHTSTSDCTPQRIVNIHYSAWWCRCAGALWGSDANPHKSTSDCTPQQIVDIHYTAWWCWCTVGLG